MERVARIGERMVAPADVVHSSWNTGDVPVHVRVQMRPALRWAEFVERLFALDRADGAAVVDLMREYPREIRLP